MTKRRRFACPSRQPIRWLRLGINCWIGKSIARRPTQLLGCPRVTLGLQGKPALTRGYNLTLLRGYQSPASLGDARDDPGNVTIGLVC